MQNMESAALFDVVVIGAGPGGYPAAIRAAQLGQRVALMEKEKLGGTCLNWGCIPTKTLLASADTFYRLRNGEAMGVYADNVRFDYDKIFARKEGVVNRLQTGIQSLLKAAGVTVINGSAKFAGTQTIEVKKADSTTEMLQAANTIIATGSVSAMPGFIPKHPRIIDSRAFLDLQELPASMIVLGGGVIGCELACLAATFGVKVTIVEMLDDILVLLDRDVRRVLRRRFDALGITVLTGAAMTDIQANDEEVSGKVEDQTISAEMLLVSVGRRAVTAELNLSAAGLSADKSGQIEVDQCGRTAVKNIYAIGDVVAGSVQLAHAATAQGVVAAENIAGQNSSNETICPACIFTSPEIGTVGTSETVARQQGLNFRTGIFPFMASGKAMAAGETEGFVKWIADGKNGKLIGAQVVGPHATELIAEAALAVRNSMTAAEFGRTIHAHPTLSETWMEAAHALHGSCIHLPKRR